MDDDHSSIDYPIRGHDESEHARVVEALKEAIRTSYPEAAASLASSESSDDENFVMVRHSDVEDTTSQADSEYSVKEEFVMVNYSDLEETPSHKSTEDKLHEEKETLPENPDPEEPSEDAQYYKSMEDTLNKIEKNELREREALASYDSTQLDYEALVGKLEPFHLEDFDRKPLPKNTASRTFGKLQPMDAELDILNKKKVRLLETQEGKGRETMKRLFGENEEKENTNYDEKEKKHLSKREDFDLEPFRKDWASYEFGKFVSKRAELDKLNKKKENQEGAASYDDELLKIKRMRETLNSLFGQKEEKENKNPDEKEKKH